MKACFGHFNDNTCFLPVIRLNLVLLLDQNSFKDSLTAIFFFKSILSSILTNLYLQWEHRIGF